MEKMIEEEIVHFKRLLDANLAEPIEFDHYFNIPVLNALLTMAVGERLDHDDPRLRDIIQRLTKTLEIWASPSWLYVLSAFPWMRNIPGVGHYLCNLAYKATMDVTDMMEEYILKHRDTLDVNEPRDFIDMMLIEINNTTDSSSRFHGQRGLESLKVTLFDLFLTGSDTTATTLTWAVLYMVRYPEVQTRVQQELDSVIGINRLTLL